MESFFTPSLDGIVNAIERQCRLSTRSITVAISLRYNALHG